MEKLTGPQIKDKLLDGDIKDLSTGNLWTFLCRLCKKVIKNMEDISNISTGNGTPRNAEETHIIQSSLGPADIHNNGAVVQFSGDVRIDTGRARAANVFTYTGAADHVRGKIEINAPDIGASNYRSRPKIRILKNGSTIAVIDDLVMQQNTAYDGDATINGTFLDVTPGTNPVYTRERFDQDNRTGTLAPTAFSNICMEAVEKFQVSAI